MKLKSNFYKLQLSLSVVCINCDGTSYSFHCCGMYDLRVQIFIASDFSQLVLGGNIGGSKDMLSLIANEQTHCRTFTEIFVYM